MTVGGAPEWLVDLVDILLTSTDEGELRCGIGNRKTGKGTQSSTAIFGIDGFYSVPLEPDDRGTCQALTVRHGEQKIIAGRRDLRLESKTGNLKPGDKLICTDAAPRLIIKREKGSAALYTTDDNTDAGRPIYEWVHPQKGWEVVTPWGEMSLGPLGFQLRLTSGPELHMGASSGLPGPIDAVTSYAEISAGNGMLRLNGAILSLGTDGGAANGLAVEAMKTWVTAAQALTVTLGAVVASLTPTSGVTPAQQSAVATALGLLSTATAALEPLIAGMGQVV